MRVSSPSYTRALIKHKLLIMLICLNNDLDFSRAPDLPPFYPRRPSTPRYQLPFAKLHDGREKRPRECIPVPPFLPPAIMTENVSISAAPEPFLSDADSGTSCKPTLRLNTIPSFSLKRWRGGGGGGKRGGGRRKEGNGAHETGWSVNGCERASEARELKPRENEAENCQQNSFRFEVALRGGACDVHVSLDQAIKRETSTNVSETCDVQTGRALPAMPQQGFLTWWRFSR